VLTVTTKQARAGEARFGRAPRGFKDLQAASYPIPHWSRLPDSNGSPSGYRPDVLPDELRRRGVPGAIRTRTADLLGIVTPAVLVYEDTEPPPGVEPGLRPYGGRAASRARRHWRARQSVSPPARLERLR
jgi:hypothetical protein